MEMALTAARQAASEGEVPVGATICRGDDILAVAGNNPIGALDPTAHAEINAIRTAARRLGNYRLGGTTLYVTIEPCLMCMGAIIHSRIQRLVFGARDPKTGAAVSRYRIGGDGLLNHSVLIEEGLLADQCGTVLTEFFALRRGSGQSRTTR
jgi:tRNA(adenine34) deaminase